MTRQPTIPEGRAFSEAWRALDRPARRRIRRAVNRGQPTEDPGEAALAVAVARGQRRFWRVGWVLGPAVAGILLLREDLVAVVANLLFALLLFGGLALFFTRRARRAEARNLEVAREQRRKAQGRKGKRKR